MTEHRLLVFKNQDQMTPELHLHVGRWFGEIESTFYNHPKSPHRDIFRVNYSQSLQNILNRHLSLFSLCIVNV